MKKNGFTLVELLVGMVISMLCILMMLSLFQQLSRAGLMSTQAAEYDTQLETGMLISQKLLQNAGYGTGTGADVKVISAASATNAMSAGVYWRLQTAGPIIATSATVATATTSASSATYVTSSTATTAYSCYRLTEAVALSGSIYVHQLNLSTYPTTCSSGVDIPTMAQWNTATVQSLARLNSTSSSPSFTYNSAGSCAPFGTSLSSTAGTKVIITGSRVGITDTPASTINRAVCMKNVPAT